MAWRKEDEALAQDQKCPKNASLPQKTREKAYLVNVVGGRGSDTKQGGCARGSGMKLLIDTKAHWRSLSQTGDRFGLVPLT